jgi:hypothetical protein
MWIIPNNYPLYSVFAQDMGVSREDLSLLDLDIESSLMWRSKPSRLRAWLRRWNRVSWLPALFGRTLKPCRWKSFETEFRSSLEVIRASHFPLPEGEPGKTIPDTYGLTSGKSFEQLDLIECSLKTSKGISRLDSPAYSAIWKKMVSEQRGEYSQRVKLAHLTSEKEFLFWATPNTMDYLAQRSEEGLKRQAKNARKGRKRPGNLREQVNPKAVEIYQEINWPTPSAHEARLGYQDRSDPSKKGTQESLTTVVVNRAGGRKTCPGHLNPTWVEWLMGVPTGLTELGCWGMELCHKPQRKPGGC